MKLSHVTSTYDMCEAVDKTMQIGEISLTEKVKHDVHC